MKTKMILVTLAAILCCTTLFTSCEKTLPDQPETPTTKDTTPVAAVMDYSFSVTDDLFNAFTLTVAYYDATGAVKSETMTSKTWTKSVKANQLPATLGARVMIKLKSGFDPAQMGVYNAKYTYNYEYYVVNKSNEKLGETVSRGVSGGTSMQYDKVPAYAERYLEKPIMKYLFNFAADGTATSGSWE